MSDTTRQGRFLLGPWIVDPEESVVRGPAGATKIDYKAMSVLCLLVDRAQVIVSREEIFEYVWPDTAVTDDVLTVAISTLRRALQDDARNPTYIRTLPKRGYSLLVRSRSVDATPETTSVLHRIRRVPALVAVGATGVVALLALLIQLAGQTTAEATIESIAVLPFENMSGDASQQYVADGITDALTTRLAKRRALAVASSASVRHLVEDQHTVEAIGRELGVDVVLEGSVQVNRGQLRLHARLVDPHSGRHVWADDYDRPLDDLFDLQSELVAAIATSIEQRDVAVEALPRVDPRAYDLYLKARYLRQQESPAALAGAVESVEKSIELSPEFAAAHTLLAEVLFTQVEQGLLPPAAGFARGREAAELAIQLDPDLPQAHAARAIAAFSLDWDFTTAGRAFARAMEAGDRSITTLKWYLRYRVVMDQQDEALALADLIREVDPRSYVNLSRVLVLSYAGRHDAALEQLRELESLLPSSPRMHATYAQVYAQAGRHDEAVRSFLQFAEAVPWPSMHREALDAAFATEGTTGVYRYLSGAGSPLPSAVRAKLLAILGEGERAMSLLEESVAARDMTVLWINADSSFDDLRPSPRFRNIVRTIGLREP